MPVAVTPGLMAEVNTGFKTAFYRGLERVIPQWPQIAMRVPSNTATEIYPFAGMLGTIREWVGNRIAQELAVHEFEIKNKHFEGTLRVNRDRIEDDQFGFYGNEAEALGEAAARHPDKLVFSLLSGGFTTLCFDGQYFFDTDHPSYGATAAWSNKGTTALSGTSYGVARAQMRSLVGEDGEPLDINPDTLIVGPSLEETALQMLNADWNVTTGTGGGNIWKGSAKLIISPRLTDSNDWFLLDSSRVAKAFVVQMRKEPVLQSKTNLQDDNVFERNEFIWGVDYRGNAGYGLPQLAFGASVT